MKEPLEPKSKFNIASPRHERNMHKAALSRINLSSTRNKNDDSAQEGTNGIDFLSWFIHETLITPGYSRDDCGVCALETYLSSFLFFQNIQGRSVRLELCKLVSLVRLDKNEHLFQQGDSSAKGVFVILKGSLKVFTDKPTDAILYAGDVVGFRALLENTSIRNCSATALSDTVLLQITADMVQVAKMKYTPSTSLNISVLNSRRRREVEPFIENCHFFRGFPKHIRSLFCSKFDLIRLRPGEIIDIQNKPSVHIIVSGTIDLQCKAIKCAKPFEPFEEDWKGEEPRSLHRSSMIEATDLNQDLDAKKQLSYKNGFVTRLPPQWKRDHLIIGTLGAGQSFGERALLANFEMGHLCGCIQDAYDDDVQKSSLLFHANETTVLLTINASVYQQVMQDSFKWDRRIPTGSKLADKTACNYANINLEYVLALPAEKRTAPDLLQVEQSLRALEYFLQVPIGVRSKFCKYVSLCKFPAQQTILRENNSSPDYLYIVTCGSVAMHQSNECVSILAKGEAFGLNVKQNDATFVAREPTCLLRIHFTDFATVFDLDSTQDGLHVKGFTCPNQGTIHALTQNTTQRNAEECNEIIQWASKLQTFRTMSSNRLASVCTNMQLVFMKDKEIVFKQKDAATKRYLVLNGSVSLHKLRDSGGFGLITRMKSRQKVVQDLVDEDIPQDNSSKSNLLLISRFKKAVRKSVLINKFSTKSDTAIDEDEEMAYESLQEKPQAVDICKYLSGFGDCTHVFMRGEVFGQTSLSGKSAGLRSGTAIARGDTILCIMSNFEMTSDEDGERDQLRRILGRPDRSIEDNSYLERVFSNLEFLQQSPQVAKELCHIVMDFQVVQAKCNVVAKPEQKLLCVVLRGQLRNSIQEFKRGSMVEDCDNLTAKVETDLVYFRKDEFRDLLKPPVFANQPEETVLQVHGDIDRVHHALEGLPILRGACHSLNEALGHLQLKHVPTGTYICFKGEPVHGKAYIIVDGSVQLSWQEESDGMETIDLYKGDIVAEECVALTTPLVATAKAKSNCNLLIMEKSWYEKNWPLEMRMGGRLHCLKQSYLFGDCSNKELSLMSYIMHQRRFMKDQSIDINGHLAIIKTGVCILDGSSFSTQIEFPETIGEEQLVHRNFPNSIKAKIQVELFMAPIEKILEIHFSKAVRERIKKVVKLKSSCHESIANLAIDLKLGFRVREKRIKKERPMEEHPRFKGNQFCGKSWVDIHTKSRLPGSDEEKDEEVEKPSSEFKVSLISHKGKVGTF